MTPNSKLALTIAGLAGAALGATQAPGTVLTSEDLFGDFLFRRPFPAEGREWVAVVPGGAGPTVVRASVRWNAGLDAGDSIFTLSIEPQNALLVVAGVPGIREGPVVMATPRPEELTADTRTHEIALGGTAYSLTLEGADPTLCEATVKLRDGDRSQALYSAVDQPFACDEPHFTLDWAGDLDGDGRLDVVTTLSSKYSYYPRRLWLSSAARGEALVGLVAEYDQAD